MERGDHRRAAAFRHADMSQLAVYTAWGSVVGSGFQVALQLPVVMQLAPRLRLSFGRANENVRTVVRNFVPVFISRGVNQVSGYVDGFWPVTADGAVSSSQWRRRFTCCR